VPFRIPAGQPFTESRPFPGGVKKKDIQNFLQ
jgi:hypothetical protein